MILSRRSIGSPRRFVCADEWCPVLRPLGGTREGEREKVGEERWGEETRQARGME